MNDNPLLLLTVFFFQRYFGHLLKKKVKNIFNNAHCVHTRETARTPIFFPSKKKTHTHTPTRIQSWDKIRTLARTTTTTATTTLYYVN